MTIAPTIVVRLEAVGAVMRLRPNGTVGISGPPLSVELLAEARAKRPAIIAWLRADIAEASAAREASSSDTDTLAQTVAAQRPAVAGLHTMSRLRPASWADPAAIPSPRAVCAACSRNAAGCQFWTERKPADRRGWRCLTCHPPDGAGAGVLIVDTSTADSPARHAPALRASAQRIAVSAGRPTARPVAFQSGAWSDK